MYVSGRFTTVGGLAHTLFAAVDPTTGALDPNVKATFTDPRSGGSLNIYASDITPDGSKLIAIGNFTRVNGQGRYQIAMLDLTTSPISVANWSTNLYGDGCAGAFQTYMRDIDIAPDGSHFVVATTGAYNTTYLCDTAARWETTATGSALRPTWANYTGGDTLTAVAVTDSAVYIGGHQRWTNNPYAADSVGAGAVPREGLAALDPRSGATLSWNPGRARGVGVYGFHATSTGLWIGSDTDRIAGSQYRGRMAFMPLAGGTTMPAEQVGSLPGTVMSLGLLQGGSGTTLDRTTSRTFTGTSVTGSEVTSEGTSQWRDVRGAFMVDGQLYTGWADGTFRVQAYDGSTFGPTTTIPLALVPGNSASLNRFATEDLPTITGMFYDRATGRLYFTKSGSDRLHHRSFSTESRIVGAQRIDSDLGAAGVTWTGVQSMFLASDHLYTSGATGDLRPPRTGTAQRACPSPGLPQWSAGQGSMVRTGAPETPSCSPGCRHRRRTSPRRLRSPTRAAVAPVSSTAPTVRIRTARWSDARGAGETEAPPGAVQPRRTPSLRAAPIRSL